MDISQILKNQQGWKEYSNSKLTPLAHQTQSESIEQFARMISYKNSKVPNFLERYIKHFIPDWEGSESNRLITINQGLRRLELFQLIEILSFSHVKELSTEFYNFNEIEGIDISDGIKDLYFNAQNKWGHTTSFPFQLISVIENSDGKMLLFSNKGEEIKYINSSQKWVSENKTGFILLYVSKSIEHRFISISGIETEKKKKAFFDFIEEKFGLQVGENKYIFTNNHFQVFRQNAKNLTRVGNIERLGRNEVQNRASRNNVSSSVNGKLEEGDTDMIGGDLIIPGLELNIGFTKKGNKLSLSKRDILPEQYSKLLEYFIHEIYFKTPRNKTLAELFQDKLSGKTELINLNEDEFRDSSNAIKIAKEIEYPVIFQISGIYHCERCKNRNILAKDQYLGENQFICSNCRHDNGDFMSCSLDGFFLDFDEYYYTNLINFFEESGGNYSKNIIHIANHNSQSYTVNFYYGPFHRKSIYPSSGEEISVYLSPLVCKPEGCMEPYEIIQRQKSVMLFFNIALFENLKDDVFRSNLINEIIPRIESGTTQAPITNINNFHVEGPVGQIQNQTQNSAQN